MSRKSIAFLLISCWISNVMSLSSFEVVSVNRGKTDSFRVGKDGCKNDSKVCSTSATCREADGLCLCSSRTPTYRKFLMTSLRGVVYGCVQDSLICLSSGNGKCFAPLVASVKNWTSLFYTTRIYVNIST